jgi:hypothetical protein
MRCSIAFWPLVSEDNHPRWISKPKNITAGRSSSVKRGAPTHLLARRLHLVPRITEGEMNGRSSQAPAQPGVGDPGFITADYSFRVLSTGP